MTSTSPAWGDQGQTSEQVTINGSGFAPGARPAWALNGIVSSDVQVVSTQYVSSKQLVATVNIAPTATLAFYDVQVTNATGTKGIGSDLFEVTIAFPITGLAIARGTNDYGMAVGNMPATKQYTVGDAALWIPSSPLGRTGTVIDLGQTTASTSFTPEDIDQAGKVIVGEGGPAYYWLKTGSGWTTAQQLPQDPAATAAWTNAIASDPVTGNAVWVGGLERFASGPQPRTWSYDSVAHTFTRFVMPIPSGATGGRIRGVNAAGEAVGTALLPNGDVSAAYWNQSGTAIMLPPAGDTSSAAAISSDGTMIVGKSGGLAVYWMLSGGAWTGPFALPGDTYEAVGMDKLRRIVGNGCVHANRRCAAAWVPPYTTVTYLPGLGNPFDAGQAYSISPSGKSIVGTDNGVAAGWQLF